MPVGIGFTRFAPVRLPLTCSAFYLFPQVGGAASHGFCQDLGRVDHEGADGWDTEILLHHLAILLVSKMTGIAPV